MRILPAGSDLKNRVPKFTGKAVSVAAPREKLDTTVKNKNSAANGFIITAALIAVIAASWKLGKNTAFGKKLRNLFKSQKTVKPEPKPVQTIEKPKFLYHMTSLENYNSMLAEGKIRKSMFGDGVFFSDINDLRTKYSKPQIEGMINWYGGKRVGEGGPVSLGDIVLLKLPVTPEEESMLCWRRIRFAGDKAEEGDGVWNAFADFNSEELKKIHNYPLEFLYKGEVPLNKVQRAAQININEIAGDNMVNEFWTRTGV